MYPVSNAFLTAVKANTRKYYWTGKITTTAGTVYNFDQEDMVKGSGYIWGQCCGSTEIKAYDYMVRFEKAFTSLEAIGNAYDFRLVLSQAELKSQVEQIILDMVADPKFKDYMVMKMDEKVDVSSLENERDQVREQLRQVVGAKKKLAEMLDRLDVNDKHYDRKYQDMHDRLDILYDRISELEDAIAEIEEKISGAYGEKITANELYKVLLSFDRMYFKMTDLEKKRFMREFIDEIELYPERQEDGRILKQLSLGFPVFYEGSEGDTIRLLKQNTVETIVLIQKKTS